MNEKKFREFELFYSGIAGSLIVRNNYHAYIMQIQDIKDDEYIHVIEYSAYEQAQKELELLRKAVKLQSDALNLADAIMSKNSVYIQDIQEFHNLLNKTKGEG